MCLASVLNVAEASLGQSCPPAGPGAARWPRGMRAALRKASSSHPGRQKLLSLTHVVKDPGRSDDEQPKWSWIWPRECNMPEGICFVLFYLFRYT